MRHGFDKQQKRTETAYRYIIFHKLLLQITLRDRLQNEKEHETADTHSWQHKTYQSDSDSVWSEFKTTGPLLRMVREEKDTSILRVGGKNNL
jgi:hypothetical protein